jgi:LCP family protein required for cell wall assembly
MTTRRERREARGRRRRRADGTGTTRTWPRFSWVNFARRYVLALGLACIVIVGGLVGFRTSVNQKLSRIHTRHGLTLSHEPAANSGNFLVIGSDSRSFVENKTQAQAFGSAQDTGGQRSDTIMIAHVDPSQKRMLVVSLPRDTIVDVPGMGRTKINAAFNAGPQRLIDTIKQNFNVDIQHYVEVGFDSFSGIVDAIGHVPVQFPAPAYDPCTGLYIPTSGTAELNGQTALQYVRSRHLLFYEDGKWRDASPRADLDRIARQQGFIRQLATLAFKKAEKDVFAANDIADSVVSKLTVDTSLAQNHGELLALVRAFRDVNPADPTTFETVTLPVRSSGNGLALQQPDADQLFQRLRTFGGPAPAPKDVHPEDVHVRVLNGTGVTGKASGVLDALSTQYHFVGAGVGDAPPTTETEVHYAPKQLDAARTVQLYLGGVGRLGDDPNITDGTVVVVLGSDFKAVLSPAILYALGVAQAQAVEATTTSTSTTTTTGVVAPKPPTQLAKREC